MINQDDWLSPAAFVARIDLEAKPVDKVQRHSPEMARRLPRSSDFDLARLVVGTVEAQAYHDAYHANRLHWDDISEEIVSESIPHEDLYLSLAGPRQSKET